MCGKVIRGRKIDRLRQKGRYRGREGEGEGEGKLKEKQTDEQTHRHLILFSTCTQGCQR